MNNLRKIIENINISMSILENEPMSKHTTFKVGGCADYFVSPSSISDFTNLIKKLREISVPYFILGGGSNLVVSDKGIEGVVISTSNLRDIKYENEFLECECGVMFDDIMQYCIKEKLSGLESFSGLPGSVGGAVFMNARCYDVSLSDKIKSVTYFDIKAETLNTYFFNKDDWGYKKSPFQTNEKIIISATFNISKCSSNEISSKIEEFRLNRESKGHFKYPSAGSVFKNNRLFGKPSGKIVDEAGLLGYQIGGAQVAPWHGNFIINANNASASDIYALVEYVKNRVFEQSNFTLECEILFVGKWK